MLTFEFDVTSALTLRADGTNDSRGRAQSSGGAAIAQDRFAAYRLDRLRVQASNTAAWTACGSKLVTPPRASSCDGSIRRVVAVRAADQTHNTTTGQRHELVGRGVAFLTLFTFESDVTTALPLRADIQSRNDSRRRGRTRSTGAAVPGDARPPASRLPIPAICGLFRPVRPVAAPRGHGYD